MQKPSAQIPEAINQHEITEKIKDVVCFHIAFIPKFLSYIY